MNDLMLIDGSEGEGGGQVLRSSLALSICCGKPFKIQNIRAKRKKPGLLRQHLTAVNAAARISNAEVDGNKLRSQELEFRPNAIQAGEYHFSINTAGSTTLVLQTILVPLLFAKGSSKVVVEGGTHNPMAPPFDFFQRVYIPILERMGAKIKAKLVRPGFFPTGGGRIELEIEPASELYPLKLMERKGEPKVSGVIYLAGLSEDIAERERKVLARKLDCSINQFDIAIVGPEHGPANVISVFAESDNVCEVFTGFGQKGVKAEIVAKRVVDQVRRYIDSDLPVDEHLADQLLLPMAIARGGEFVTCELSQHTATNINTIRQFLDSNIVVDVLDDNSARVLVN